MKARVDENRCVGCGICANICSEGIEIINGKARIKNENANCLKDAAINCPQGAIIILDDTDKQDKEIRETERMDFNQNYGQEKGFGMGQGRGLGKGRGLGMGPQDGRGQGRGGGRGRW